MKKYMIALDLDGTALDSAGHITDYTKEIFKKAVAMGHEIVISSGRSLGALPQDAFDVCELQYAITSNGSSIFSLSGQKRLYARDMAPETVVRVLDLWEQYDIPLEVFAEGISYTIRAYYEDASAFGVPKRVNAYVRATRHPVDDMHAFVMENLEKIEGLNIIAADPRIKKELLGKLSAVPKLYLTASTGYYIEMAAEGVSKATALSHLAAMRGFDRAHVIAFGDRDNDAEMLTYAGTGVAMANATPLIRSLADAHTLSNDEDGVAVYLEKHLLA